MHSRQFYEHIDQLFSVYMKPHKTGLRNDDTKSIKSRKMIGFMNFSELLNKLCLESNPYQK